MLLEEKKATFSKLTTNDSFIKYTFILEEERDFTKFLDNSKVKEKTLKMTTITIIFLVQIQ